MAALFRKRLRSVTNQSRKSVRKQHQLLLDVSQGLRSKEQLLILTPLQTFTGCSLKIFQKQRQINKKTAVLGGFSVEKYTTTHFYWVRRNDAEGLLL